MINLKAFLKSTVILTALLSGTTAMANNAVQPVETAPQVVQQVADAKTQVVGDKVNINTATAAEIQKALIGIGAKKAEAIVQYREKHGNFTSAEQLLSVQGIGKATLEKNQNRIAF